jgi:hypothetical protein
MNPGRHKRELGMGHGEAYIGQCGAYRQDVRILDTDGGCNREMNCPYYKISPKLDRGLRINGISKPR